MFRAVAESPATKSSGAIRYRETALKEPGDEEQGCSGQSLGPGDGGSAGAAQAMSLDAPGGALALPLGGGDPADRPAVSGRDVSGALGAPAVSRSISFSAPTSNPLSQSTPLAHSTRKASTALRS